MNVFKINKWVLLCCFTLPFIFFQHSGYALIGLYIIFYILLFLFLINPEHENYGQHINIRHNIECGIVVCLLVAGAVAGPPAKGHYDEPYNSIFSILIFGSIIDLAVCFSNLWRLNPQQPRSFRRGAVIFLALMCWPLGIFHFQWLYQQKALKREAEERTI